MGSRRVVLAVLCGLAGWGGVVVGQVVHTGPLLKGQGDALGSNSSSSHPLSEEAGSVALNGSSGSGRAKRRRGGAAGAAKVSLLEAGRQADRHDLGKEG